MLEGGAIGTVLLQGFFIVGLPQAGSGDAGGEGFGGWAEDGGLVHAREGNVLRTRDTLKSRKSIHVVFDMYKNRFFLYTSIEICLNFR